MESGSLFYRVSLADGGEIALHRSVLLYLPALMNTLKKLDTGAPVRFLWWRHLNYAQFKWIADYYRLYLVHLPVAFSLAAYQQKLRKEQRTRRLRYETRASAAPPWLIEESEQLYTMVVALRQVLEKPEPLYQECLVEAYKRLDRELGDYPLVGLGEEEEGALRVDPRYRWLEQRRALELRRLGTGSLTAEMPKYVCPVAAGDAYALFLRPDGTVWITGDFPVELESRVFVRFHTPGKVVALSCGNRHAVVLLENGDLWGYGSNSSGQLGTEDEEVGSRHIASQVVAASCGARHTMFIRRDGSLWACGDNHLGQLGLGRDVGPPVSVVSEGALSIACGWSHSALIMRDGSLWTSGSNIYGQLGTELADLSRGGFARLAEHVKQVSCGRNHTMFITNEGDLWACGSNSHGQLAVGRFLDKVPLPRKVSAKIESVACGKIHTLLQRRDGSTVKYGSGIGVGLTAGNVLAIACGASTSFALDAAGNLWAEGANGFGELGLGEPKESEFARVDFQTGYHP